MNDTTADLRPLLDQDGPFITMILPTRSEHADAAHRFEIERKNALKSLSSTWSDDELRILESRLASVSHGGGEAVVVVHPMNGPTFYEFIENGVERAYVTEGPLPRLAPLIEARQRTIAHVVIDVDLAGADITAFDGGTVVATETTTGETEFIHRGHPGGWSQRRFQQRAENTWEDNADDVADAAAALAEQTGARVIAVVGPTRARSMVAAGVDERVPIRVEQIDAGDPEGAADEITRLTADVAANDVMRLIEAVRERVGTGTASTSADDIRQALTQGRVETLLVHDDENAVIESSAARLVDWAIQRALATDAHVHVVPNVSVLDDGLAATLRW